MIYLRKVLLHDKFFITTESFTLPGCYILHHFCYRTGCSAEAGCLRFVNLKAQLRFILDVLSITHSGMSAALHYIIDKLDKQAFRQVEQELSI